MRSRTLMLSRVAAGATPMTSPVPGPRAAAAREAVQVPWPSWSCGVPSSQALGRCGLIDFAEVEGEVGGDVGVGGVDAAVEDGDADAFAHGGVPGASGGAAGDVVAVAAYLTDGPALGGVCSRCRRVALVRRRTTLKVGMRGWAGCWRMAGR